MAIRPRPVDTAAPDAGDRASAGRLLAAVGETRVAIGSLEADQFRLATEWALLHPGEEVETTVAWQERELQIAGDGAPTVAEFAVPDLALMLGVSTDAGRGYLGDALETRYRLPLLWRRVMAGQVAVWKARRVAQATRDLPVAGAAHVDRHLAPAAHRCSLAQLERTVEEARVRFDAAEAEARRIAARDHRQADVHLDRAARAGTGGTVDISAVLDLADALDLDDALAHGAAQLAAGGNTEPLDIRRALALGLLARNTGNQALDLTDRDLTIYLHLHDQQPHPAADTPDGADHLDPIVGVENTRSIISLQQLKDWCSTPGTSVTIRPVIDLNADLHTDAYTPTPTQREQVILTNPTCVFPGCTRPSRRLDLDHLIEHDRGGPTTTANLAPECRGHHRLKTHTDWTVTRLGPTRFEWTSPHGWTYLRDTNPHQRRAS